MWFEREKLPVSGFCVPPNGSLVLLVFEEKNHVRNVPLKEIYQIREEEDTLPSRREKNPAGLGVFVCVVEREIKKKKMMKVVLDEASCFR